MTKARLLGPLLMIALGAAMLVGPAQSAIAVGGGPRPCEQSAAAGIAPAPCNPCDVVDRAAIVQPCPPLHIGSTIVTVVTTTTVPETTVPETTVPETTEPETTEPETTEPSVTETTGSTETTAPADVSNAGTNSTPPSNVSGASNNRPNVARSQLARTGSNSLPMTVGGISLIILGAGLAIIGRRTRLNNA